MIVIGWDVGGVNTKAARVENGKLARVDGRPFELQRAPDRLVPLLRELACDVGAPADPDAAMHAVTMTAELSQMFRTKREGVAFVLEALANAFSSAQIRIYTVDGRFLRIEEALEQPIAVAAANWTATANVVARRDRNALLVDIGTTTTDLIPIVDGVVVAEGRTDPERLASGELVYTGALRTPAEAIAADVVVAGRRVGTSAEGFAVIGDAHLWRGDLSPSEYTVPTPDGRPATREYAGERLARVICADREILDERALSDIADALAAAQTERIAAAMRQIVRRHSLTTAVVTGLGAFVAERAALLAGLDVVHLSSSLGADGARFAPAAAVALLLDREINNSAAVDLVVKLGGSLLSSRAEDFDRVLRAISARSRIERLLVVPGGGPFADVVRHVDSRIHLSDDAAHWMAILGMDQYAQVLTERLDGAVLVSSRHEIEAALASGRIPVLAPSRWLRAVDPLPHSWDVTSDSIAAWVAGALGASRLVLVKPSGAPIADGAVDPYFSRALAAGVSSTCVSASDIDGLFAAHECRQ